MTKKGVTLLEIMISIIISIIVLGCMYLSFAIGLKKWEEADVNVRLSRMGLFAIEKMVREIRQAVSIYEADNNKITIDVDINPQDSHTEPERVSYYLDPQDSTILLRKIWGEGGAGDKIGVIARNVESFSLLYRNNKNELLTPPFLYNEVALVEINLVLREAGREFSLYSSAHLRNWP